MAKDPYEILKKFWGYDTFKQNQLEIIKDVLAGSDVLALLPTGGGKSLCFQVPALVLEGLCVVISPLIALIQDQVNRLSNQGIKAIGLTAGISRDRLIELLDNCDYGGVKFLYMSPERLRGKSYTMSSDVWSLGLVLLECLRGESPFEDISSVVSVNIYISHYFE